MYAKRLTRFCDLKIIELKEYTNLDNEEQIRKYEGQEILKHAKGHIILMDVKGTLISSEMLAEKIKTISMHCAEISFVIGGSYGVSQDVKNACGEMISVSKMTFPHRLFRVMLLEQIYRSFTIINNIKYHK